MRKKRIAIFASGSGTNAERIISYFQKHEIFEVTIVLSNKSDAYVLERAKRLKVNTHVFNRDTFNNSNEIPELLAELNVDLVVLAGFLWLIPSNLIRSFPDRIINIHPALLPQYGGKGMYGRHVHEAVIANGEKESGISIHLVNEVYDEGRIIFQEKCEVKPGDSPETLAQRIHELEYQYFPRVIEDFLEQIDQVE